MPLPSNYTAIFAVPALSLASRGAGTYRSDPLTSNPSNPSNPDISNVELWLHVNAVSGSPTIDCALEISPDGITWEPIAGSATPQLASVGSTVTNGAVPLGDYVRVASVVGGSGTPTATYRVLAIVNVPQ